MANGPVTNGDKPGSGYDQAMGDMKTALHDKSTYDDYLNAAAFTLFNTGLDVNGKRVDGSFYYDAVYKSLISDDYQRYLRYVKENSTNDVKRAATYFYNLELNTVIFFSGKKATEITIERHSAELISAIKDTFNGNSHYSPELYFDTTVAPYVLTRMKVAIASSSNGLVKSSASALQLLISMMTTDKTQVAGIKQNREIQNLMIILSGGAYLDNAANITLQPDVIDEAVENAISGSRLTFSDFSARTNFTEALQKLNASGLLGTIGLLFNITRSVYDTLNLKPSLENGRIAPNKILSLISRYMSVFGGLGNALQFVRFLSSPAKKAFLVATRALRFDRVSAAIWGSTGTLETEISLASIPATVALDNASTLISNNFAELPFAEETGMVERMFEEHVSVPARALPSTGAHSVDFIVDESISEIASQVETITSEAISSASAMSAVKAFGASTALVGFVGEVLGLAASVVDISLSAKPSARDFINLSAGILGVTGSAIGLGIAYGFLESAAFPPLSIALAIASIILGLGAAIDELVEENHKKHEVRRKMTEAFQSFEANGYLHEWGEKIEFLSIYFDKSRDLTDPAHKLKRWSAPEISIFEDESAAWRVFQKETGSTARRFYTAADKFVHAQLNL
ncbi:hypothetical protein [Carnimonas bestiolae]